MAPAAIAHFRVSSTPMLRSGFTLLIFAALVAGCQRGPELSAQIQAAGGGKVIRDEVSSLLRDYEKTGRSGWGDVDPLPEHLASFCRSARVMRAGDVRMVVLGVSGRRHHGLLVIVDPIPAAYHVTFGNCSIWRIEDGIYEYRE